VLAGGGPVNSTVRRVALQSRASKMTPGIHLTKIWFDNEVVEFEIKSSDGKSLFSNKAYVGHRDLNDLIEGLSTFKHHVYGGLCDIAFGSFGPEYAGGAFHARLHFQPLGKILVTVKGQSDFREFGKKTVASEATLFIWTEPILLDNFISELKSLASGKRDHAHLEAA
jgi:hypothetical protein